MTTTPTGSPAWTRTVGIADYGGDPNKSDYLGFGVVNPKTDVSAAQLLRLTADLAALIRGAPLCTVTYTDGVASNPTVTSCIGMAWNNTTGYPGGTPPTGYPSVTRNANGDNTIAFSATYTDAYGVSGAISIGGVAPSVADVGNYLANYTRLNATNVRVVTTVADTGAAATGKNVTVSFW